MLLLSGQLYVQFAPRPHPTRFCSDWERIDNLRIDKYYTLVRVFVREALAFCRMPAKAPATAAAHPKKKKKNKKGNNEEEEEAAAHGGGSPEWDLGLVGAMTDVMEDEVLTLHPAPIGVRLHLADVWAEETCKAGGEDMPTEAFLVALAPWLRASAHPETNAVVFKRTFEGVFEGLLQYFPEEKEEDGMEQEEEEGGEEEMVFKTVELDQVQACLFEVAAAPQVREGGTEVDWSSVSCCCCSACVCVCACPFLLGKFFLRFDGCLLANEVSVSGCCWGSVSRRCHLTPFQASVLPPTPFFGMGALCLPAS